MDHRLYRWTVYFWIQAQICCGVVLGTECGSVSHLSQKDILLLATDNDPKCFTRTQCDLTCFWEGSNNKSYNFFYRTDGGEKLCNLTQQKMEDGSILHVCSFPTSDVFTFTLTHIRVIETSTNSTTFSRSISVEDQVLLDPPTNVSLQVTGEAGQLQVAWRIPAEWRYRVLYELRYSSYSLPEKTEQIDISRSLVYRLDSLFPGEVCSVQMRVTPNGYSERGHWSDWSHPTVAMVPQQAAEVDLLCHTSDLRNIRCQWNDQKYGEDSNYTLSYKLCHSGSSLWQQCTQMETAARCVFTGDESGAICVSLSGSYGPLSRIFYSEPFRVIDRVKSDPPWNLRGETEGGRLCLQWEPPLRNLSRHLMYQVRYQPQGELQWKLVTLQSSMTSTCLDVQAGSQYLVQIKSRPNGSVYSGLWSDWSNALTVSVPSNTGTLLLACIPFTLLFMSVLVIAAFSKHFSKIKQHLWPPVPNLDKVLEGFLTDINQNCQNTPFSVKQCYEDSPASVVEIVSEREALGGGKIQRESVLHIPPKPQSDDKGDDDHCLDVLEASQDYVVLKTESFVPCLQSNEYVAGKPLSLGEEDLQVRCCCTRSTSFPSSTYIFNHSYLLLAEQSKGLLHMHARGVVNQYTNLENAAQQPVQTDS